ncbi:MAG: rhomboid family intramembrane serine protease [Polyangiaceae bacterium]|jgi:rhomboid protease GluP|nr:rhomboid family intramembrane serine protease [Polyangiaceae bacterium]
MAQRAPDELAANGAVAQGRWMLGGFNCPWCGYYNANDEKSCGRCGQRLPPPGVARLLRRLGGPRLLATKTLVFLNVLIFALQYLDAQGAGANPLERMPASTLLRFGALTNGLEWSEPVRLLSACFVHMSPLHLLFNMMALVQLGRVGEEGVGPGRFLVSYVASGVAGFAVSGLWYQLGEGGRPYITAGASGAVFGLTGLLVAGLAVRRDPRWKEILVQQLIYSFLMYYALRTNQAAHLGGLVAGVAFGVVFWLEKPSWRLAGPVAIATALSALGCLASLVLPHTSPLWKQARAMELRYQESRRFQEAPIRVNPAP